jgi:hypothetical protein
MFTLFGAWRNMVARLLWEQEVAGSNPVAPTISPHEISSLFLLLSFESLKSVFFMDYRTLSRLFGTGDDCPKQENQVKQFKKEQKGRHFPDNIIILKLCYEY